MLDLLTVFLAVICLFPILLGYRRASPENVVFWVLGMFSFGHFVLPLIFRSLSPLRFVKDNVVIDVVLMAMFFLTAVMVGATASLRLSRTKRKLIRRRSFWDQILFVRPRRTFYVSLAAYFVYVVNSTLTVYQTGGVENFIENYRPIDAIIAFFGNFGLALMAIVFARGLHARTRGENFILLVLYLSPILLLLATAQRSAVLIPFICLASAISLFGHARLALKTAVLGAATIVVLSPLLVFFRETSVVAPGMVFSDAVSTFSFDEDAVSMIIASIVARADVLFNMALVVENFPYVDFATDQYFYSVILKFIPGIFYSAKPIALSSTGAIDGHLSVIAWRLAKGDASVGSLTIFGAITAFREGGWVWMIVNGLLTGGMYTFLFRVFGEREDWKRVFYVMIFPALCVKNVPPSFFDVLTLLSSFFYLFLFMAAFEKLLGRRRAIARVSRSL